MKETIERYLKKLHEFAADRGQSVYVVGGTLRDRMLGKPCTDYDFTCKEAGGLGRDFASREKLPCVPLDNTPGRQTVRVVIEKQVTFDFTDQQGTTIEEDLNQRDFSFNALAIPLKDFLEGKPGAIDPHHGRADLESRLVRVLPGPIFESDPLRMLRAFRFAGTLDFKIDNETLERIGGLKNRISETAVERIFHELVLFLGGDNVYPLLESMDQSGLLECLLPETTALRQTRKGKTDEWALVLRTFQHLEKLLADPGELFGEHAGKFEETLSGKRKALLKLASLLYLLDGDTPVPSSRADRKYHGRPKAAGVLKRLRAGNMDIEFVTRTIQLQKEAEETRDDSGRYRFCLEGGEAVVSALLLFGAARLALAESPDSEKNPVAGSIRDLLDFYHHRFLPAREQSGLITGDDLIRQFNLSPSPLFKSILARVEEARVLGSIRNRQEAEALVKTLIETQ